MVRNITDHPEYVDIIRAFVEERGGIKYATEQLDAYIARAKSALAIFPESEAKNFLMQIADFNVFRQV